MNPTAAGSFQQPAVLGADIMGGRLAALLANAGLRVKLYDRPPANKAYPANANPLAAIERLYQETPPPFSGSEAASLIIPRNYRDHFDELREHDIILETYSSIDDKRAWLTRLAPGIARDAIIISLTGGLPAAAIADAIPAGMRPRFLGISLNNHPRYRRRTELIPTDRTEDRVLERVSAFLADSIGLIPAACAEDDPLRMTITAAAAVSIAFHSAEAHQLSLGELEAATALLMGRQNTGICLLADNIGRSRLHLARRHITDPAVPPLPDTLDSSSPFYRSASLTAPLPAPDIVLRQAITNADWQAIANGRSKACRFAADFLPRYWRYIAASARRAGKTGSDVDLMHRHAFDWTTGPYQLLQQFTPGAVFGGQTATVLPAGWRRKTRSKTPPPAKDLFLAASALVSRYEQSSLYDYRGQMLLWQPHAEYLDLNRSVLEELTAAAAAARRERKALMIYHHGSQFGGIQRLVPSPAVIEAEQQALFDTIIALRMLPQPVMISVTGTIADNGCAIMMQADRVISTVDLSWKLRALDYQLPPIGGTWFEWLRRLPRLNDEHARMQIHAVLDQLYRSGGISSSHEALQLGILRTHDRFVMNPTQLSDASRSMADAWLGSAQPRPLRHPLYKLTAADLNWLDSRADSTPHPELYRESAALLAAPNQSNILSLRRFLPAEAALYNRRILQHQHA